MPRFAPVSLLQSQQANKRIGTPRAVPPLDSGRFSPSPLCLRSGFLSPTWRRRRPAESVEAKSFSFSETDDASGATLSTYWWSWVRNTTRQQRQGFLQLMRIHNYIPSCLLVLTGAWKAVGIAPWRALSTGRVWAMAFVAAGIAVGSVVVNDYFDYLAGVDVINDPDRPLPRGLVRPDIALLITLVFYATVLVMGCVMEPPALRQIIAFSAATTLLYTPLLKSLTLIKNCFVASVTALTPISGALAAGTGRAGVEAVLPASGFLFGVIVFREILMDTRDRDGDRAAGVYTLPVVLGRPGAFAVALAFLLAGSVVGGRNLPSGRGASFLAQFLPPQAAVACVLLLYAAALSPLYASGWHIWRGRFDKTFLKATIDRALVFTAFGLLFVFGFG